MSEYLYKISSELTATPILLPCVQYCWVKLLVHKHNLLDPVSTYGEHPFDDPEAIEEWLADLPDWVEWNATYRFRRFWICPQDNGWGNTIAATLDKGRKAGPTTKITKKLKLQITDKGAMKLTGGRYTHLHATARQIAEIIELYPGIKGPAITSKLHPRADGGRMSYDQVRRIISRILIPMGLTNYGRTGYRWPSQ